MSAEPNPNCRYCKGSGTVVHGQLGGDPQQWWDEECRCVDGTYNPSIERAWIAKTGRYPHYRANEWPR